MRNSRDMAEPQTVAAVPQWDLGDRLVKALKHGHVKPGAMSRHLGISPGTLHNWTTGKIRPKDGLLRSWADRCGVPYEWLANGTVPDPTGPGLGIEPTVTQVTRQRHRGIRTRSLSRGQVSPVGCFRDQAAA